MLGKRKFTGAGRGITKRRTTGSKSSVGVSGAGFGSVRYAGKDYYGSIATGIAGSVAQLGVNGAGLHPVRNTTLFERIASMVKGFAQYRFTKFNVIIKGKGGQAKGQISLCFFHNDGKGGTATITTEPSVKGSGNPGVFRGDQSGMFKLKMDREWFGMDTDAGTITQTTRPGIIYYHTSGTTAAADCEWDVWVDYVIELKDPVRIITID